MFICFHLVLFLIFLFLDEAPLKNVLCQAFSSLTMKKDKNVKSDHRFTLHDSALTTQFSIIPNALTIEIVKILYSTLTNCFIYFQRFSIQMCVMITIADLRHVLHELFGLPQGVFDTYLCRSCTHHYIQCQY